jgi:hypothetical protein
MAEEDVGWQIENSNGKSKVKDHVSPYSASATRKSIE